ncbi:unnamed protein product [Phytophthora lilii]|uniref:Unnamed protein product n=1 Tax=Phytophthora lilii TaxID=2077276 RepID=A0A9W6WYD4_9STRA|nr:unnamed protein product [Phytophthora lilii]
MFQVLLLIPSLRAIPLLARGDDGDEIQQFADGAPGMKFDSSQVHGGPSRENVWPLATPTMAFQTRAGDFLVEAVLLFQILEAGPPEMIAVFFAAIVVANALSCAALMGFSTKNSGLTEIIVDILYVPSSE